MLDEITQDLLVNEKLKNDLRLNDVELDRLTPKQKESIIHVLFHQGAKPTQCYNWNGTTMIQFPHITIGVEPDGYAHS